MPTVPSLPTWGPTGVITATQVNNNLSTIRTYVNTYAAFVDVANTFTLTNTFAAITATTCGLSGTLTGVAATFSSNVAVGGSATVTASGITTTIASSASGFSRGSIFTSSNHDFWVGANNGLYWGVQASSGHWLAYTDAVSDIGASGANRPRAIYTSGAATFGGALTVTGNSTITGTLGGVTTLTCTTVTATNGGFTTLTGAVNFSGTPTFGAGLTVTSGTTALAALTCTTIVASGAVSGITTLAIGGALSGVTTLSMSSNLTFTGATTKLIPGATNWAVRNNADTANVFFYGVSASQCQAGSSIIDFQAGHPSKGTADGASTGHLLIPACAGVPTGTADNQSFLVDTTNNKLMVRIGGTWKGVTVA